MANPAIVVSPGQIIPQSDWEALSHQHGDTSGPPSLRAATKPEMVAAAQANDEDSAFQQHPIYRYNLADGSYVEARTAPNGQDYQIIDYKPSARFTASHPASGTAAGGSNTSIGTNPVSGRPTQVTTYMDGRPPTYDDTQVPAALATQGQTITIEGTPDSSKAGGWDNTRPRKVTRDQNGKEVSSVELSGADLTAWRAEQQATQTQAAAQQGASGRVPVPGHPGTWQVTTKTPATATSPAKDEAHFENDAGQTVPTPADAPTVTVQQFQRNGKSYTVHTSTPKDGSAPTITVFDTGTGNQVSSLPPETKPSDIWHDPQSGRVYETTYNPDGTVKDRHEINSSTIVKPTDIPVLQARYGEIAQGVGQTLAALNGKVARGEMTPEERTAAFTAVHQQADTQVSEINSILTNSRAAWGDQITQRGQTLADTAGRRSFADAQARNAIGIGSTIAQGAGPGHGADIAAGVQALMGIGQRYAEGLGAFKDSPEIAMPLAMQQAQAIGLPGFGSVTSPEGVNVAQQGAAIQQSDAAFRGLGITPAPPAAPVAPPDAPPQTTTDTSNPVFRPQPPVEMAPASPLNAIGATIGQGLTPSPIGVPVAMGGQGLFDPRATALGMIGDGSDPEWAAAVARAHQDVTGQPLYGGQG